MKLKYFYATLNFGHRATFGSMIEWHRLAIPDIDNNIKKYLCLNKCI